MSDQNYALYYPTLEFRDYEWLWAAALLWDRIYKIVPEGYEPEEPDNVAVLMEEGEVGIPIRPEKYAKDVANEFKKKLESRHWEASAVRTDFSEDKEYINFTKVKWM